MDNSHLTYLLYALLGICIFCFFYLLIGMLHEKGLSQRLARVLNRKYEIAVNYTADVEHKLSTLEMLHLKYIERSFVQKYIPFLGLKMLFTVSFIGFGYAFYALYPYLRNVLTCFLFSAIIAYIPFIVLEVMSNVQADKSRRDITAFLSGLRTWSNVKADIVYVFEKTSQETEGALGHHARAMVSQIKGGLDHKIALEIFRAKIGSPYFDMVILNISHAYTNQGDLTRLFAKLEKEAYRLEQGFNKRMYKTLHDRIMLSFLMGTTLLVALNLLVRNEAVRQIYISTPSGQVVLSISTMLFALGVYKQFKITEYKH